jgi:hypothetical protein
VQGRAIGGVHRYQDYSQISAPAQHNLRSAFWSYPATKSFRRSRITPRSGCRNCVEFVPAECHAHRKHHRLEASHSPAESSDT